MDSGKAKAVLEWILTILLIVGSIYVGVGGLLSFFGIDMLSPLTVTNPVLRVLLQIGYILIGLAGLGMIGYGIGFLLEGFARIFEKKSHRETGATIKYPS